MQKVSTRWKFLLVALSAIAYAMMDIPVQMTGILPSYAGIKNFLPFTLGLFFGVYGAFGCCIGCLVSMAFTEITTGTTMYECLCILITGLGMFYGWHMLGKSGRISFKKPKDYLRYILLLVVLSALCMKIPVSLALFLSGLFVSIPVNIIFSSLLYIEPVIPRWCKYEHDAEFKIVSGAESLEEANEEIELTAVEHGIKLKQVLEVQSCLEELSIRIFNAIPEAEISAVIQYGEAVSARLSYVGRKYNPFKIEKDEDEIDIMSLKIIKHRALRASFSFSEGINHIHVVI